MAQAVEWEDELRNGSAWDRFLTQAQLWEKKTIS